MATDNVYDRHPNIPMHTDADRLLGYMAAILTAADLLNVISIADEYRDLTDGDRNNTHSRLILAMHELDLLPTNLNIDQSCILLDDASTGD